jgi:hypothetical protein
MIATAAQMILPIATGHWWEVKDGDDRVRQIFDRHYSRYRYKDGREPLLFVGPGAKMVLVTVSLDAIFAWRKFISRDGQPGVNCAIFRNESEVLSSALITEADRLADQRWPGERHYTYVDARRIRSTNPGYCFQKAGWKRCGVTKIHKRIILEKLPA